MSYEIPGFTRSYEAAVDLSGSYLKFVKKSGALIVACAAATDNVIGVLQNKPNEPGVGVFTGAAIAAGVAATIDAQGRVVAAGAGNPVVGVTETAAANADEVVSLLLKPLGAVAD
jgi:glutamate racemase